MQPAQPHGASPQPMQGMQPMPPGPGPAQARKGGGKTGLIIALVAVLLAGGGVAAFLLLRGGGDGGGGGQASAKAALDATIAALAAGDGERVVGLLAKPAQWRTQMACKDREPGQDDKEKEDWERFRKDTIEQVGAYKGVGLKLKTGAASDEPTVTKKGEEISSGCEALKDYAIDMIDVVLEYQHEDEPREHETRIIVGELDGRWYLLSWGELPDRLAKEVKLADRSAPEGTTKDPAGDGAKDAGTTSAAVASIREALTELATLRDDACKCSNPTCADDVDRRFDTLIDKYKDLKPAQEDLEVVGKTAAEMRECLAKAQTVAEAPTPAPTTGTTGMPACDAYLEKSEKLATCDKIPQDSRDAIRQGLDAAREAWKDAASMGADFTASMDESCKQMLDGIEQSMSMLGC
jgi:hypothetical protein